MICPQKHFHNITVLLASPAPPPPTHPNFIVFLGSDNTIATFNFLSPMSLLPVHGTYSFLTSLTPQTHNYSLSPSTGHHRAWPPPPLFANPRHRPWVPSWWCHHHWTPHPPLSHSRQSTVTRPWLAFDRVREDGERGKLCMTCGTKRE